MTLFSTISVAIAALLRNKMRSLLTTLGIVIGVGAVVIMQSMGEGATAYVGDAISGLGSNMLVAAPGSSRTMGPPSIGVPLFTTNDVDAIRRLSHNLERIAPLNSRMLRCVAGSNNHNVSVIGATVDYFDIRQWSVVRGRPITPDDNRQGAQVCIIGQSVAEALFAGSDPIGKDMRVHDVPCRVVGILETKGTSAFGMDQDDIVFMPFTTFLHRIIGNDRVGSIMMKAVDADRIDDAKAEITEILKRRRHILPGEENDFAVRDMREVQALLQSVTGMLTTLLAGVAAISLLVGGIGIMNIMLVSVTERTREIGIRLAVGGRGGNILAQFLVEAVILSGLGGMIGIGFGLGAAYGVAHLINVPYVVPVMAIPIAFGVSVLVGVVFGVVPARKASRLNPLAALRFE